MAARAATSERLWWAPRAWLPAGWASDVLLRAGDDGRWAEVSPGVRTPPAHARRLPAPVLPGLVNAHSHAFQRAFAGLAERRDTAADDFWSWRDRMYRVALRVSPDELRAVAAQLAVELLQGGYTHLCEFHYLHRAPDGTEYPELATTALALAEGAAAAGIGLTLMPTLYERAGFGEPGLRPDQRRFAAGARAVFAAAHAIARSARPLVRAGLAVHSLRAARAESIHELGRLAASCEGPIHIHVAEQTAEVDDCLAATGVRPIAWLAREGLLDPRWQLVHATHAAPAEIDAVARSGAGVVLCPSTEANLGDGLADVPRWLEREVPLTIGSDSHVTRDWREELRCLEYGQRLGLRRRNVCALPPTQPSTAARLWQRVQAGGAAASGEPAWGLVAGARADLLLADPDDPATLGVPVENLLDALVFSSPVRPWPGVMVAGRWVVRDGRHGDAERIAVEFRRTMEALWAG